MSREILIVVFSENSSLSKPISKLTNCKMQGLNFSVIATIALMYVKTYSIYLL